MKKLKRRLTKDPLVHFLAVGFLLFLVDLAFGDRESTARPVIEITESDLARLDKAWRLQWRRPPTAAELRALVDSEVREQIFYREAILLGLDDNDTIVRRRLAQKMEFLIEAQQADSGVTDGALSAYFQEHQDRYLEPSSFSFNHVFFSADERKTPFADAGKVLKELENSSIETSDASGRGDRFYPSFQYRLVDEQTIARDFGAGFAEKLAMQPTGKWSGPIESGLGWHIVFLDQYTTGGPSDFDHVRERVQADYSFERRREILDSAYAELRKQYDVRLPSRSAVSNDKNGQATLR